MKIKVSTFLIYNLIFLACSHSFRKDSSSDKNKSYLEYKKEFDSKFISHFPKLISDNDYTLTYSSVIEKNNVGLVLYYYNLSAGMIDTIKNRVTHQSYMGCYKSADSCLLVVNRFETIETSENGQIPVIKDSTIVNRECYKKLYPIPNFIEYSEPDKNLNFKEDGFVIYVLEAHSGKHFNKFKMSPSPQMPTQWKNGYSKGIAISVSKKAVIYWSIIW